MGESRFYGTFVFFPTSNMSAGDFTSAVNFGKILKSVSGWGILSETCNMLSDFLLVDQPGLINWECHPAP